MNNKRVPIYFLIFVSLAPIALLSACVDLVVDIKGIRVLSYAGGNRIGAGDFEKPDLFKISDIEDIEDGDYVYSLSISGKGVVNDKLTVTRGTATIGGSVLSLSDWNSLNDGEVLIVLTIGSSNRFTYRTTKEQYKIRSWQDLQGMKYNLNGNYTLMNSIELPGPSTNGVFPEELPAEGFNPVGYGIDTGSHPFTGSFDGQNHVISNFFIERGEDFVGLFGSTDGATIENVGIEISTGGFTGRDYVGGLVGSASYNTTITNSYATGNATGKSRIGGLVGEARESTTITNCYATGNVTGDYYVGGLVGNAVFNSITITNSYATGNVTGDDYVGGLAGGANHTTIIISSYATSSVTGKSRIGGLAGSAHISSIYNSYATGSVAGEDRVGGLVGSVSSSTITNSYATGGVRGTRYAGGLVGVTYGSNNYETTITNSYATGSVTGNNDLGGLVGAITSTEHVTITSSYWDIASTGQTTSDGGTGISSGENLQKSGNNYIDTGNGGNLVFIGWGFGNADSTPWHWLGNKNWPVLYY